MSQLISIIIPVFNQAEKISECLESILDQTYTDWEVIVVNDGSTDNITEVISLLKGVKSKSFILEFGTVLLGPKPSSPRLIWATGNAPVELIMLRNQIQKALNEIVRIPRGRVRYAPGEFLMHATLARLRPQLSEGFPRLPMSILWRMQVKEFVLYESILKPQGAEYTKLARFNLL
jgi:2'-5' RNA ligase